MSDVTMTPTYEEVWSKWSSVLISQVLDGGTEEQINQSLRKQGIDDESAELLAGMCFEMIAFPPTNAKGAVLRGTPREQMAELTEETVLALAGGTSVSDAKNALVSRGASDIVADSIVSAAADGMLSVAREGVGLTGRSVWKRVVLGVAALLFLFGILGFIGSFSEEVSADAQTARLGAGVVMTPAIVLMARRLWTRSHAAAH